MYVPTSGGVLHKKPELKRGVGRVRGAQRGRGIVV